MASLEQWTNWREEYLAGMRTIVDNIPINAAAFNFTHTNKRSFDINKARSFVNEAIEKGYINLSDPKHIFKVYTFAWLSHSGQGTVTWAEAYYNADVIDGKDMYSQAVNSYDGFISFASWFVIFPLLELMRYNSINNPLKHKRAFSREMEEIEGVSINLSYGRLSNKALYDYFREMTSYGLYRLLSDINCPATDEIFESIKKGRYRTFKRLCENRGLDFFEVSDIAGLIVNAGNIVVGPTEYATAESVATNLLSMVGDTDPMSKEHFCKTFCPRLLQRLFPYNMTEEEVFNLVGSAWDVSSLFTSIGMMEKDERQEVDRVLENPIYENFIKLAQAVYIVYRGKLPHNIPIYLSPEELTIIGYSTGKDKSENGGQVDRVLNDTDTNGLVVMGEKNLASRWMTEPYHRMSDEALVELISKKIWPQLLEEVDGLQWKPTKRVLPTFPKTKNALAACVLFHSLELARIAKLPRQADDEVSDVEFMSAEDRAQAGISATSNRNAGITHIKKKYNDTLPVGYMEVLEKFIKEEELPGRTTSRTYLKLVNKWVKMKLESISDNIDSEASAQLFVAECKNELGPQFEIFQDNRVRLKALLKKWRDSLPELFNIPI